MISHAMPHLILPLLKKTKKKQISVEEGKAVAFTAEEATQLDCLR